MTLRAAKKRQATKPNRARPRAEWDSLGLDEEAERARYLTVILPGLARVSAGQIAEATGLSLRYASLVKRGLRVPHPVHLPPLEGFICP